MTSDETRLKEKLLEIEDSYKDGIPTKETYSILHRFSLDERKEATDEALRWAKQMIDLHGVELGRAEILMRINKNAEIKATRKAQGPDVRK